MKIFLSDSERCVLNTILCDAKSKGIDEQNMFNQELASLCKKVGSRNDRNLDGSIPITQNQAFVLKISVNDFLNSILERLCAGSE